MYGYFLSGDGGECLLLRQGQFPHHLFVSMAVFFQNVGQRLLNGVFFYYFAGVEGKDIMEDIVDVEGVPVKQVIAVCYGFS